MSGKAAATKKEVVEDSPYSKRMLVLVNRDMTNKTPKVIWSHEFPLLQEIFGEGNVEETDPSVLDEGFTTKISPELLVHNKKQDPVPRPSSTHCLGHLFIGDRESEYERLAMVYGNCTDENMSIVEKVYGRYRVGAFKKMLPAADLSALPPEQLKSLLDAYGVDTSESTDLVALAREAGIETE